MAKLAVKMPDDFMQTLGNLAERTDELIAHALKSGGEAAVPFVASALAGSIGKGPYSRPTGKLQASLGVSPAKMGDNGVFDVKIGFASNRTDGERNAKLAALLEYGKKGQPPRPFMSRAKSKARKVVLAAMQQQFLSEVHIE